MKTEKLFMAAWGVVTGNGMPLKECVPEQTPEMVFLHGGNYSDEDIKIICQWISKCIPVTAPTIIYSASHWGGAFTSRYDYSVPSEGADLIRAIWSRHPWTIVPGTAMMPMFIADGSARNTIEEVQSAAKVAKMAGIKHIKAITVDAQANRAEMTFARQEPDLKVDMYRPGRCYQSEYDQRIWDEASRLVQYSDKGDICCPPDWQMQIIHKLLKQVTSRP